MKYRLALDMGSTSLGWCLLGLDVDNSPASIINMGVRIFSDGRENAPQGKVGEPLAVARRNARGMRRNKDRRKKRQEMLMAYLIETGLMPEDYTARKKLEHQDPYEVRALGIDKQIPLHHLGRALFHINQRRGFKSNRRADKKENDAGNMKNAIKDMEAKLCEWDYELKKFKSSGKSRTLGEYFWKECLKEVSPNAKSNDKSKIMPTRVRTWKGQKDKQEYNFYPSRKMYQDEVAALLQKQSEFYPSITQKTIDKIQDIIFFQRPLRPVEVGYCRFDNKEKRARLALPIVQKFRILQEVNNLQLDRLTEGDPEIDQDDRKKIIEALKTSKKKTFGQLRTLLKISRDCRFNLESENRDGLTGDTTSSLLSDKNCFGEKWTDFSDEEKADIINLLFSEPDPDTLVEKLITGWNVSPDQAENIANAPLPDGYGRVSVKAIEKMLPFLEQGMKYSDAAEAAGYHHSDRRNGEVFEKLPYYGEMLPNDVIGGSYADNDKDMPEKYYGKINNPTVHIALNQVRKLVNTIIETYGHPEQVVIELARELKEPADDISREQAKNQKDNERINKELAELGVKQNYRNRMLFKLWEDLCPNDVTKRCCLFSGVTISKTDIVLHYS
jgi:CRISPR-associated endonuclease Csn1